MSRYRPTQDGGIAFVGSGMVLTMSLEAAKSYHGFLASKLAQDTPLAGAFQLWADDLGAAIEAAEGPIHDLGAYVHLPAEPFTSSERTAA